MKTVFASILIPKCVFSKTKMQNILNHRIQSIMKINIFRKIKSLAMQKPFENNPGNFEIFDVSIKNTPTMLHQKV